ncbi:hypothetical protein ABZ479_18130 [Streptomyces sp. NPDC005722]
MVSPVSGSRAVVYVPCDTFQVHVRAGFGDVLSPIEMTALRLVDALERDRNGVGGTTSVDQLVELLGLGHRVTLELLHDVWRKGYVRLDFTSGGVLVTDEVRTRINEGTLHQLPGAETLDYDCAVMIDRLTGLVQPRRGHLTPSSGRLAMEPALDDTAPAQVARAELVPALEHDLRRRFTERVEDGPDGGSGAPGERYGSGRPPRVLSYRAPNADTAITERRWIPLDVLIHEDPDSGRLQVAVADRTYPVSRHLLAGERLTQLAADNPSTAFVRALRGAAGRDLADPPPLERLLTRLTEHAERAHSAPAGTRAARHRELCDEARVVATALDNRAASEVRATPVPAEEHEDRITELISQARSQLVVAVPRITVTGWRRWETSLRRALADRVTVVLLWGDQSAPKLPDPVHNALVSLVRQYGNGRLLYPRVASCPGNNVIICDSRAALISARDFMGHPERQSLGLLLSGPGEDEHSAVVGRLLSWAAGIVPTAKMSRLLRTTSDDFGCAQPILPDPIEFPVPPPDEADAADQVIRAWSDSWTAYAGKLTESATARELPAARVVDTDAHVDLLWRALRSARRRLVISSDRPPSPDDRFLALLDRRLRDGVWVTLGLAGPPGQEPAELVRLADEFPGRLRLVPARGRVLVRDDEVLVGGKDLLGEGGRSGWNGRVRPAPGIVLTGADAAARLAAAVGEPPEVAEMLRSQATRTHVGVAVEPRVVYARQNIVTHWRAGAEGAARLRTQLGRVPDAWAVVDDLARNAGPDVVAAATACCLLYHADTAPPGAAERRLLTLVEACWQRGDFTRAALLRRALADPAARPRPPLSAIAAARGRRGFGEDLWEVVADTDPDIDEQAVLLLLAVEEVLRSADESALEVVTDLAAGLGEHWAELGGAVRRCNDRLYGLPAGPEIRRALSDERQQEEYDAHWQALEQALLVADRPALQIKRAIRTHHVLFREDRLFGRIRTLSATRDGGGLAELLTKEIGTLRRHGDGPAVVAELVDDVWRNLTQVRAELLHGDPRESYINRLGRVLDLAWQVAADSNREAGGQWDDRLDAVRELARTVTGLREHVELSVHRLGAPEALLGRIVLGDMKSLYRLGDDRDGAAEGGLAEGP